MRNLLAVLFYISFFYVSAQSRIIIEPSKEYVQHLDAAKSHKLELIKDKKQLEKYTNQGKLIRIAQRGYGWRIADLSHSHAFLIPKGKDVLRNIARDFVKTTGQNFFVVTSLTRTLQDQNRLRGVNSNASSNDSAHNFGAAFDISYIRFNHNVRIDSKLQNHLENILKSYVTTGKIYYVKESKSKCFHIIVRNY